jgi:hypothetical protein
VEVGLVPAAEVVDDNADALGVFGNLETQEVEVHHVGQDEGAAATGVDLDGTSAAAVLVQEAALVVGDGT